jgi:hypothetical protein
MLTKLWRRDPFFGLVEALFDVETEELLHSGYQVTLMTEDKGKWPLPDED